MADAKSVKFRASSCGQLMVGGTAISDKQIARLGELEARKLDSTAKPLTQNMQQELEELIAKRDGEFKFGQTAKAYIRDCWLRNEFGYDEPLVTNEILKGIMCENEAIDVLSRQLHGVFRVKNEDHWEDDHFTGTPDIVLDEWIEDVKCPYTLRTFVDIVKPDPIYYAQGQVYMALTGRKNFRLAYVLLDTPIEIVEEEVKRFYFRFNCDESNPHYLSASKKTRMMHAPSQMLKEADRLKTFEFSYDQKYIDELRFRVDAARKLYATLSIGGWGE